MIEYPSENDRLNLTFAALADPTRRAILDRLSRGDASVLEIAEPFSISLPAISKHLKVLERAGLISRARNAQWRPCKINAEPLHDLERWLDAYRALWDRKLDRLDTYIAQLQSGEKKRGRKK